MYRRPMTIAFVAALTLALWPLPARAQLEVVTSTTDLYAIAKAVGGDRVTASHISEGYQDPHFVEAKPSFILKLRNADVFAFGQGFDQACDEQALPVAIRGGIGRAYQQHDDVGDLVGRPGLPRGLVNGDGDQDAGEDTVALHSITITRTSSG